MVVVSHHDQFERALQMVSVAVSAHHTSIQHNLRCTINEPLWKWERNTTLLVSYGVAQ